jgi:hypothetical protein
MTTYTYQATDSSGKMQKGTLDALSLQAARNAVAALGLEPVEIYESQAPFVDPLKAIEKISNVPPTNNEPTSKVVYFPLLETLRLYAGWLLAWYSIVYAVGAYQFMKDTPYRIPYAESLFLSPLVLSFTFAAFLFLLFSGVYKMTGRSKKVGIVLAVVGIATFLLYKMNVQ